MSCEAFIAISIRRSYVLVVMVSGDGGARHSRSRQTGSVRGACKPIRRLPDVERSINL